MERKGHRYSKVDRSQRELVESGAQVESVALFSSTPLYMFPESPLNHPCTTRECQDAALAAMHAQQEGQGPQQAGSIFSPRPGGGKEVPGHVHGGNTFVSVLASGAGGGRGLDSPLPGDLASPRTPAKGSSLAADDSITPPGTGDSDAAPKTVRFSDEERDNLHVGLKVSSRSSSAVRGWRAHAGVASATAPIALPLHAPALHTPPGALAVVWGWAQPWGSGCWQMRCRYCAHACCPAAAGLAAPQLRCGLRAPRGAAGRLGLPRGAHRGWARWWAVLGWAGLGRARLCGTTPLFLPMLAHLPAGSSLPTQPGLPHLPPTCPAQAAGWRQYPAALGGRMWWDTPEPSSEAPSSTCRVRRQGVRDGLLAARPGLHGMLCDMR